MQLTSLIFLCLLLPLSFLLFVPVKKPSFRKSILVLASIAFYSWGDFANLFLILFLTIYIRAAGKMLKSLNKKAEDRTAKLISNLLIAFIFIPLAFYKVIDAYTLDLLPNNPLILQPRLPIGLSFITFSAASYLIDIANDELEPEANIIHLTLFIFLYPKILQGPIVKYQEVQENLRYPKTSIENITYGVQRFIFGLGKKALLADSLSIAVRSITETGITQLASSSAWIGLFFFSMQIFIDFSAYTDMAIGLGRIFGFVFPENFNFPYASTSLTDFWRRWHITLTSWFRQYLFLPLETARRKSKFMRQQTNLLLVFFVTGLWHGLTPNFIIWGLYNGIIIGVESLFFGKILKKSPKILQHFYALALIVFGWLFFLTDSLQSFSGYLSTLFSRNTEALMHYPGELNLPTFFLVAAISLVFCFPLPGINYKEKLGTVNLLNSVGYIFILILSVAVIIKSGFSAFLYEAF